jgi:hypothetical protein
MGFTPRQIRQMSIWDYSLCIEGWQNYHNPEAEQEDDGMTPELFRKLMDAPVTETVN